MSYVLYGVMWSEQSAVVRCCVPCMYVRSTLCLMCSAYGVQCGVVWCGVVCCETHPRVLLELFDLLCRARLELTPELDKLHVLHMHKDAAGQTYTHTLSWRLGCYNLKRVTKNQWQSYTQAVSTNNRLRRSEAPLSTTTLHYISSNESFGYLASPGTETRR